MTTDTAQAPTEAAHGAGQLQLQDRIWLLRVMLMMRGLEERAMSLYRPGNQTRAVVLSLGFGVFLMSTLYQVHHSLLATLDLKLTQARANLVFFDVQQDQETTIDSIIRANGYTVVQQVPLVSMRIAGVNGKSTAQLMAGTLRAATGGRGRRSGWPLRREYRSTYRDYSTPSEKVVEGRWFTPTTDSSRCMKSKIQRWSVSAAYQP